MSDRKASAQSIEKIFFTSIRIIDIRCANDSQSLESLS
ncbi:hypothetical protein PCH70_39690 [Pseudomonas cichorii JBC1]|nr:hypothetical protein PCH70_39690 [Pseudomonas cichorii JBC1]